VTLTPWEGQPVRLPTVDDLDAGTASPAELAAMCEAGRLLFLTTCDRLTAVAVDLRAVLAKLQPTTRTDDRAAAAQAVTRHLIYAAEMERKAASVMQTAWRMYHDLYVPETAAELPAPTTGSDLATNREATVPHTHQPAEPTTRHSGYDPNQPRAADGKWTAVGDALGRADDETCFGSDRVRGIGTVPTDLLLMDYASTAAGPEWDNDASGNQFVEVVTPCGRPDDVYAAPDLAPAEAETAARHLDELADLAESGWTPPKPSRYARAAARLEHLVDEDHANPGERIMVGDDEEFPLTVKELRKLLRDADPAGGASVRRKVPAKASAASGGEAGVLWLDLEPGDDGTPRIAVTAIEGDSDTPDTEFWREYTAHHTPDSARELAAKLRSFAGAARRRASRTGQQ
jgi:hypothetical protein